MILKHENLKFTPKLLEGRSLEVFAYKHIMLSSIEPNIHLNETLWEEERGKTSVSRKFISGKSSTWVKCGICWFYAMGNFYLNNSRCIILRMVLDVAIIIRYFWCTIRNDIHPPSQFLHWCQRTFNFFPAR